MTKGAQCICFMTLVIPFKSQGKMCEWIFKNKRNPQRNANIGRMFKGKDINDKIKDL